MKSYWRRSIGLRFTMSTLTVVVVLSVVFVAVEAWFSFRREVRELNYQLAQIEDSHLPAIVQSLWLTDYELLQNQIDAIARFPHVMGVSVVDDEGSRFAAGRVPPDGAGADSKTLTYSRRGTEIEIGEITIAIDQKALQESVLREEMVSAAGHILTTLIIGIAVALLFNRQVGRHIVALSSYVRSVNADTEAQPLELARRGSPFGDELEALCSAINELLDSQKRHLREKELLMREVHHRVKNDVYFLKSLLSLQAAQVGSIEAKEALGEATDRIGVMGEIYQRLYRGSNVQEVEVEPVAQNIIDNLKARGIVNRTQVRLTVTCAPVTTRLSIAVGVILNELVTNAVKHGTMDAGGEPQVMVTISDHDDRGHIAIEVRDNGPGIPEEVVRGERSGFGLTVVQALTEQYQGEVELKNADGAVVTALVFRQHEVIRPAAT